MAYCPCAGATSPSGSLLLRPGVAPRLFGTEAKTLSGSRSHVRSAADQAHRERVGHRMRRVAFAATAVMLSLMASGIVACTGVGVSSAPTIR
jgi:hypothetical protein